MSRAPPLTRAPMSLRGLELCNRRCGEAETCVSLCTRGAVSTTIVDRLELDAAVETRRIAAMLRVQVGETLRRGGGGVAGGGGGGGAGGGGAPPGGPGPRAVPG